MKIDILARDGSPLGVTESSISGEDGRTGVGGAELAILTLCRGWHDRGYDVTFYNDPIGGGSAFKQKRIDEFNPQEDRDILIIFRSPNPKVIGAKGKKIWFSCDQYTIDNFKEFADKVDVIVGISEFHSNYFKKMYGINNMKVIDIPVRTWEYQKDVKKKENACIFTSVPDRGLLELIPIWDKIIERVPDATLTITSDWSLWCGADVRSAISPYRMKWAGKKGVTYKGAVKREELIQIQQEAEFHLYPCVYEELFCISVSESQVAGAVPITSTTGALATTNRFGYKIEGNPVDKDFIDRFAECVIAQMVSNVRRDIRYFSTEEFGIEHVLDQWDEVFSGN